MAGNASFGRLSTEAGVKAFITHRGMEPGLKPEDRRRRWPKDYLSRGSVSGRRPRLMRSNTRGLREHTGSNRQYLPK
ncbi:hypothetical protein GCM10027562_37290 [Arthrobacter pigmenti]